MEQYPKLRKYKRESSKRSIQKSWKKDPTMNNYKEPDKTTLSGQYGNRLIWTNKQEKWQWEGPD